MKNSMIITNDAVDLLICTDDKTNRLFINGTEIPSSSWVGSGSYEYGSITIDKISDTDGNIQLIKVTDTHYKLVYKTAEVGDYGLSIDGNTLSIVSGGGSSSVNLPAGLQLGETSSTAYRGDRGKTAYDHSQLTSGNPHNVTKTDVGLGNVGNFKAVSTEANQGLTTTEQSNARTNIGAGTSSFSGSYNDLTDKPTIPAAQVNSDWNATSGVAEILNKPTDLLSTSDLVNNLTTNDSTKPLTASMGKALNDSLSALPGNYLRRFDWWDYSDSYNANNLHGGTTFAYNVHNCPTTGTIAAFDNSRNAGYTLQIQGSYSENRLFFRNLNGDVGTWKPWYEVISSANIGSQSVSIAQNVKAGSGAVAYIQTDAFIQCVNLANSAYAPINASAFNINSSKLVKENIKDMTDDEARKILEIDVVDFDYIKGEKNRTGVIAEDILEIMPNVVTVPKDYDEDKVKEDIENGRVPNAMSVDYSKFVPYLIKMVQIQQKEIEELKARLK